MLALSLPSAHAALDCETHLGRANFINGFQKRGLPVSIRIQPKHVRQYSDRLGPANSQGWFEVKGLLKHMEGMRSMDIVGGLRGQATTTVIILRDVSGQYGVPVVVQRFSWGDPRTQAGKAQIQENVRMAEGEFRDRLIARAVEVYFAVLNEMYFAEDLPRDMLSD